MVSENSPVSPFHGLVGIHFPAVIPLLLQLSHPFFIVYINSLFLASRK
jgi:hypothetical protein